MKGNDGIQETPIVFTVALALFGVLTPLYAVGVSLKRHIVWRLMGAF